MGLEQRRLRLSVLALVLIVFTLPHSTHSQQPQQFPRIGVLAGSELQSWSPFREALRESGYIEGQNITSEWRFSGGKAERFSGLAAELVRLKVDVIVALDNSVIAAAQKATSTIPIVMVVAMDPIASGFVGSLGRPGGNITGMSAQFTELQGKMLQLLKEAVPAVSRVAILWDPTEPGRRTQAEAGEVAGRSLGLQVKLLEVRSSAQLESLFTAMVQDRVDAVLVQPSQLIGSHRARIAQLATKSRLPTMGPSWFAPAGGFMSYAPSRIAQLQRVAHYVDKVLRGAKPADMPVEQPTTFELVINMKTAKMLGLTIPQSLLLRADRVIE